MALMEQLLGVVQGHWDHPEGHVLQRKDRVRAQLAGSPVPNRVAPGNGVGLCCLGSDGIP